MQLDLSFFGVFIMVLMAVGSFLLGRWLSRHWRACQAGADRGGAAPRQGHRRRARAGNAPAAPGARTARARLTAGVQGGGQLGCATTGHLSKASGRTPPPLRR